MDPNANLDAQAQALANRREDGTLHSYDRYALYDLRCALRDWLCQGGAEPNWDRHPDAGETFLHWDQTRADHQHDASR